MWLVILLFVAGLALIFAELLLPGAVLGILGGILVVASAITGWVKFPEHGLMIVGGEFAGVVLGIGAGFYVLSATGVRNLLVMNERQDKNRGYASPSEDEALLGKHAEVQTALRPAGSILYEGRRIDAVSDGTFIDAGTVIEIIEVEGHRVVCEEIAGPESGEA